MVAAGIIVKRGQYRAQMVQRAGHPLITVVRYEKVERIVNHDIRSEKDITLANTKRLLPKPKKAED